MSNIIKNSLNYSLADLAKTSLNEIDGISQSVITKLNNQSIFSVLQLLEHYPRRYIDKTNQINISEITSQNNDFPITVYATVIKVDSRRTRQGRSLVTIIAKDDSGEIEVTFFNQAWRSKQLHVGVQAGFNGKVTEYRGKLKFTNPIVDVFSDVEDVRKILPVYPQFGKDNLMSWHLFPLIQKVINQFVYDDISDTILLKDYLTKEWLNKWKLKDLATSYKKIHLPETFEEVRQAKRRLRFNEFFRMQYALISQRNEVAKSISSPPVMHQTKGKMIDSFIDSLPWKLTSDQEKVLQEISKDMADNKVMHRLLQGEVGSGKTLVALASVIMSVQSGNQALLMAPTEVLATQHYLAAKEMLKDVEVQTNNGLFKTRPFRVALLTGKSTEQMRNEYRRNMELGDIDLVIGTHALLFDKSAYPSLGLVVIDEQHRFGVEQRALLSGVMADANPDLLVMTATPIPRTAAMLLYGDLELSEIKNLPKGRKSILTKKIDTKYDRKKMLEDIKEQLGQGRQIYFVCPLIEESEKLQAKSATELFESTKKEFKDYSVGLLHGQLSSEDKEKIMSDFRNGNIDVLVSTTVIEVGVDVANASVMVIESANRFGISQLHQLRGRIGRGKYKSYCYLCVEEAELSQDADIRMNALVSNSSGFDLAEIDLELRGAGQVFGSKQSGFGDLKLGKIPRDIKYVEPAKETANYYVDNSKLVESQMLLEEIKSRIVDEDVSYLVKS